MIGLIVNVFREFYELCHAILRGNWTARCIQSFLCLFFLIVLYGFKPMTHMHSANLATSTNTLRLDNRHYPKNGEVMAAVQAYPDYYRGGVIGPDGFPDIIFGQGTIHPNMRCESLSPNGSDTTCHQNIGSFTYEWLSWIFDRGLAEAGKLRANGHPAEADTVLAFTYGFLTHAAGDLWAHSLVNSFAKGIFPSIGDMASDTGLRNIGVRHIVVESYIEKKTPANVVRGLNAPIQFLRTVFIRDREPGSPNTPSCPSDPFKVPTPLGKGSHFDSFLNLRKDLCDYRNDLDTEISTGEAILCGLSGGITCVDEIGNSIVKSYVNAWIIDIDDGLEAWPKMSLSVAKNLFEADNFDGAKDVVERFAALHVLAMAGAPDFIGGGIVLFRDFAECMAEVLSHLNPLAPVFEKLKTSLLNWLFSAYTGMSYEQWKEYTTNPATYINNQNMLGLESNTSQQLDTLMGVQVGNTSFSDTAFATFKNATTLSELILMKPETLDEMLFDLHVGKIYTGEKLVKVDASQPPWILLPSPGRLSTEMQKNAMLGFTRLIDGNHAWRRKSPDLRESASPPYLKLGEGMPIWRDCLARSRVFPKLFTNSARLDIADTSDPCEMELAEALAPITIHVSPLDTLTQPTPACYGFEAKATLKNHLDYSQAYSFYYRISRFDSSVSNNWQPVFHRVRHREAQSEVIPALSDKEEAILYSTCVAGQYQLEIHVFRRMNNLLGVSPDRNIPVAFEDPYFNKPVEVKKFEINIDTNPQNCPLTNGRCPGGASEEGSITGSVGASGLPIAPAGRLCLAPATPCDSSTAAIVPVLDADGDGRLDTDDNCPVDPNDDQRNSDKSGFGDACEILDTSFIRVTSDWLKGRVPDVRIADAIRGFLEGKRFPTSRGPWPCLTCPNSVAGIKPLIESWLADLNSTGNASLFVHRVSALANGVYAKSFDVDAKFETFDAREQKISWSVTALRDGWVVASISRAVTPDGRRPRLLGVRVDGHPVQARITTYSDRVSAVIPIKQGTKITEIRFR